MTDTQLTQFDLQQIEEKLVAARTRLILDKPFLGALVLRLPLQTANPAWCPTTGTDARKFYYNPEYIRELRADETQFVLAHEALHCALSHFARRQHRVKQRWDLACDYAINPILLEDGLKAPPGMIMLKEFAGMTAEEIYPCIDQNDMSQTLDQHLYDKEDNPAEGSRESSDNPLENRDQKETPQPPSANDKQPEQNSQKPGTGQQPDQQNSTTEQAEQEFDDSAEGGEAPPPPLNQQEAEELAIQWQQRMAGAAQQAQQAGKLSGVMQRLVEELLQPRLPWRHLLAHYMTALARDDYSYTRPSNRRGNPAIFPTLKSQQINIAIALDVSGSVNNEELLICLSEINALKGQIRAGITLIACDADITDGFPQRFETWEEIHFPETIPGGGNTDFRPVFNWLDNQDQQPDLVVYFTDAMGYFPETTPHYPVIWLVKGRQPVPWGTRIQLN